MRRVLFVSNGHGEEAIAGRIADELAALGAPASCDHLALVGEFGAPSRMRDVGPRRRMPSGGLVAMGNVRNVLRDLRGGLLGHTLEQLRFLRRSRGTYDAVVAVGDTFALGMALRARAPAIFVGTAKSVHVAPYGRFERTVLRRAQAVFVRDAATANRLRERGVPAQAPGNVIVDLHEITGAAQTERRPFRGFEPAIALFPGSREGAYDDARALARLIRELAQTHAALGAACSLAPGLDVATFARAFAQDGWNLDERADPLVPFVLRAGERELVRAWRGEIGVLLSGATLVIGQAGTANEAAAAAGIPVVALERTGDPSPWYRRRQRGLLGDAMTVVSERDGAVEIGALLDDPNRRARMGAAGRDRMGPPGGARAIAGRIAALIEARG